MQSEKLSFDISCAEFVAEPAPFYAHLKQYSPIYWSDQLNAWLFTDSQHIKQALGDKRFSASCQVDKSFARLDLESRGHCKTLRSFSKARLGMLDAPEHTRIKHVMSKVFSMTTVDGWRPIILAMVKAQLAQVSPQGEMEFIKDFAQPFVSKLLMKLLGMGDQDWPRIRQCVHQLALFYTADEQDADGDSLALLAEQSVTEFERIMTRAIDDHHSSSQSLILNELLTRQAGLTRTELIANGLNIITAGYQPVVSMLSLGMHVLLTNPRACAHIKSTRKVTHRLMNEILRYTSPAQIIARTVIEPVEIAGIQLKLGDTCLLVLSSANRDPVLYACPNQFDHARTKNKHAAFGMGSHYCLGAKFAKLQGELVFLALITSLEALRIDSDSIQFVPGTGLRILTELPLQWQV